MNNLMQGKKERQVAKKDKNVYGEFISKTLLWNVFPKKDAWCIRKGFLNLGLLIVKKFDNLMM